VIVGDQKLPGYIITDLAGNVVDEWRILDSVREKYFTIALAPDGGLYALGDRVNRILPDGRWRDGWAYAPPVQHPVARIGSDERGGVYLIRRTDYRNLWEADVHRLREDGQYDRLITRDVPFREGLRSDWIVEASPDGKRVYLNGSHRYIDTYDEDGHYVRSLRVSRPWYHGTPTRLAVGPSGQVATLEIVSNAYGDQIVEFGPDGHPRWELATGPRREEDWLRARLTVDRLSRTHVVYESRQAVISLDGSGRLLRQVASPSWPVDVASDPSGITAVKASGRHVGRVALYEADGSPRWDIECACDETGGVAILGDMVLVANSVAGRLDALSLADGSVRPAPLPDRSYSGWPADIATAADRLYLLDTVRGVVEVWWLGEAGLVAESQLAIGRRAERISVDALGRVAVLTLDGRVRVYGSDGRLGHDVAVNELPGPQDSLTRDLAFDPQGRLLVTDGAAGRVLILTLPPVQPGPTATPVTGGGSCSVRGDKRAAPELVRLGQAVTVTLELSVDCPQSRPADIDLAILVDDEAGTAFFEIRGRRATWGFILEDLVRSLDLERHRVAVFDYHYAMLQPLTDDRDKLIEAVRSLGLRQPITSQIEFEHVIGHLMTQGRPSAQKVILFAPFIGVREDGPEHRGGRLARSRGVRVVVMDWGFYPWLAQQMARDWQLEDVILMRVASSRDDILVYHREFSVAGLLGRVLDLPPPQMATDVSIVDDLSEAVRYVSGSAQPAASGDTVLAWTMAGLPEGGLRLSYRVLPQRVGRHAVNDMAEAQFKEPDGLRRTFVFPRPEIEVVAGQDTATPQPTATQTPEPAAGIRLPYVGVAAREEPSLGVGTHR
jgi:hypothetical protein